MLPWLCALLRMPFRWAYCTTHDDRTCPRRLAGTSLFRRALILLIRSDNENVAEGRVNRAIAAIGYNPGDCGVIEVRFGMMNWLYTRGKLCAAGLLALALVLSSVDAPAPAQAQARSCYEAIFEMRETTLPPMLGGGTIRRLVKVGEKFDEACYTVGDDRVNQDNAASVAIYCRPEGIAIWDIDVTGRGTPL